MKAIYGANNDEILNSEDDQYRREESSLITSPDLNENIKSTRYVKMFTYFVVAAAFFGSTLYLSTYARGN
jgi:hypothetical protein